MKKYILLVFSCVIGSAISAQSNPKTDSLLGEIDSTLLGMSNNVAILTEELVEEKDPPFTGQSIFEDRKSSSAIFLPYGGTFKVNTADASIALSYVDYQVPIKDSVSGKYRLKPFYGAELAGKTNDGMLNLFSEGRVTPGLRANVILGKDLFCFIGKNNLQRLGTLNIKAGYEGASFKLYNGDTIFNQQIEKISFNTFTAQIGLTFKFGGRTLFGISAGYKQGNNYAKLDEIELNDRHVSIDSASGITRTYDVKLKVRMGDYKTFTEIPLNADLFWIPAKTARIGFYHYWRTTITDDKVQNGFGTGAYFLKKNNPLSAVFGVVFEVSDVTNFTQDYDKYFSVNLVAGYNFGFGARRN